MNLPAATASSPPTIAARVRRRAVALLVLTLVWNVIEAGVGFVAGIAAGSIALVGFALDSVVESLATVLALWRFGGDGDARDRAAQRGIAVAFFVLAAYVGVESVRQLATGEQASTSFVGIALTSLSLLVMPFLALEKRRVASSLHSPALRSESAQTMLCAGLSAAVLAGLVLDALLGWWWADPVAALIVAALALREGREAWRGESCCANH